MLIDQEIMELDLKAGWKKGSKKVTKENNQVLTRAANKADQNSKAEEKQLNNTAKKPKVVQIIGEYESDDEFELLDIQVSKKRSLTLSSKVEEFYNLPATNKC